MDHEDREWRDGDRLPREWREYAWMVPSSRCAPYCHVDETASIVAARVGESFTKPFVSALWRLREWARVL